MRSNVEPHKRFSERHLTAKFIHVRYPLPARQSQGSRIVEATGSGHANAMITAPATNHIDATTPRRIRKFYRASQERTLRSIEIAAIGICRIGLAFGLSTAVEPLDGERLFHG